MSSTVTISKENFSLKSIETANKSVAFEQKAISDTQKVQQQNISESQKILSLEQSENQTSEQDISQAREQLTDWVERMNRLSNENVKFNYNEDMKGIIVTVINKQTNEVIRQIPGEDAMKLSAIWKEAIGNIFDTKG